MQVCEQCALLPKLLLSVGEKQLYLLLGGKPFGVFRFNISILYHIYRLSPALGFSGVGWI